MLTRGERGCFLSDIRRRFGHGGEPRKYRTKDKDLGVETGGVMVLLQGRDVGEREMAMWLEWDFVSRLIRLIVVPEIVRNCVYVGL